MLFNIQALVGQGKRLIERCNKKDLGQNQSTITALGQEIHEYQTQVNQLKKELKTFGLEIYEVIKTAEQIICHRNKAMIGQGIGFALSALALVLSFSVSSPLGGILVAGSIGCSGIVARGGLVVHNAARGVVKTKEHHEQILKSIEGNHKELCDQQVAIEDHIARCDELVSVIKQLNNFKLPNYNLL